MKKTLLAAAITAALAGGLTACNEQTASNDQPTTQGQQYQTANATFRATFPQSGEANAAYISENAAQIEVKLYPLAQALEAVSQYASSPQEGDDNPYIPNFDWVQDELQGYLNEDTVLPQMAAGFATETNDIVDQIQHYIKFSELLPNAPGLTLTPSAPGGSVTNIETGPYLIVLHQKDANGQIISAQRMYANLGSGDNTIIANMLNAKWTFKNPETHESDQPYEFTLLERSADEDYGVDWDPKTEGNQSFWQALSGNSDAATDGNLKSIEFLAKRANPFYSEIGSTITPNNNCSFDQFGMPYDDYYESGFCFNDENGDPVRPVRYIYNFHDKTNNADLSIKGGHFYKYQETGGDISIEIGGEIAQVYDYRLAGDKNIAIPTLFELRYENAYSTESDQENNTQSYLEGGVMLYQNATEESLTGTPHDNGDGTVSIEHDSAQDEDRQPYIYLATYQDANGEIQTLYIAHTNRYQSTFTWPSDQLDLTGIGSTTTGNSISGTAIEYVSSRTGNDTSMGIEDDSQLKPSSPPSEAVATALARSLFAKQHSEASAAATHPLGENCADITVDHMVQYAQYAWINDQWVAGVRNDSYRVSQNPDTGALEVQGDDLNGDGVVSYFETGVIDNYSGVDLDGDGSIENYENVNGIQSNSTTEITACAFPVYLEASEVTDRSAFRETEGENAGDTNGSGGSGSDGSTTGDADGNINVQ